MDRTKAEICEALKLALRKFELMSTDKTSGIKEVAEQAAVVNALVRDLENLEKAA